jgi:hypothetical protein
MWKSQSYTIRGVSPLLMHNGQLADPLNQFSKALKTVTGKRNKTEADHEEMARLEWYGGLYLFNGEPCVPGMNIESALNEAARKQRKGQQAKAGLYVDGLFPLLYDGPRDPHLLWQHEAFRRRGPVRVQRNTVMRMRPIFQEWACAFAIHFDDRLLNPAEVSHLLTYAGDNVGLGDWRPKHGRFVVES